MWTKTNNRCSILFILALACTLLLASCTSSVTTGDGSAHRKNVLLEDMGNGVCRQVPSRLMWQIKKSQKFSTRDEANEYVSSLQLGGFDDWRLPTREEYLFLSELLALNKDTCPIKFKRAHWASDRHKGNPGHWEDYPLCGGSEFLWVKGEEGSVRAVRP
jgi:Protein of unknown function (DUF1566)